MADVTLFARLEPRPRANDFNRGLAAEIRDPLWFLARQWQMGEFKGDDSGSLAYVDCAMRTTELSNWDSANAQAPVDLAAPLEPQTLREPFPPDLSLRVELGHELSDLLREEFGDQTVAEALITTLREDEEYAIQPLEGTEFDPLDAASRRFANVCSGRCVDGYGLYVLGQQIAAGSATIPERITTEPSEIQGLEQALSNLLAWVADVYGKVGPEHPVTWAPSRLEYQLSVTGGVPSGQGSATLDAVPDRDGEFEWFSFEARAKDAGASVPTPEQESFTMIPSHVRFPGMPNPRFWMFEENQLSVSDIDLKKRDLLKLAVADFVLVHGADWFALPYEQKVGSMAKVDSLLVYDVFGRRTLVERADKTRKTPGTDRWTMFSITDSSDSVGSLADYHVVPQSPGVSMQLGQVLEDVRFARDEVANMAWGVERVTLSPIGEPRQGREREAAISQSNPPAPSPAPENSELPLKYQVSSQVPANWVPLLPVQPNQNSPQIVLEKAAALRPKEDGTPGLVLPVGSILNPQLQSPVYQIEEEEVPRAGLQIQRVVYRSRWHDGSTHLWVQRRRRAGAGESQSGLQFDQALPNDGSE